MRPEKYLWFRFGILAGAGLAILLLVNSVSNYSYVSRRVLVEHVRRELSEQVAQLDQQIQQATAASPQMLSSLLDTARRRTNGRIVWAQIRDGNGTPVAHAGPESKPVFSASAFRARFQKRQPVFQTVVTERGEMLVEAFPIRLPDGLAPVAFRQVANGPEPRRPFGILEIAARFEGGDSVFWPLRRNLLINSSAALALLVALTIMALRFRSYVEGKQLEQQVAIARQVQEDLLPAHTQLEQFELAAEFHPAAGVGGDFYTAYRTANGASAFVLGDVSGKGIPAALLMGVLHGAVRSCSWTESGRQHEDASAQINRLLYENASRERYASMFWAYFDHRSEKLHYVNAGHFPPMVFRPGSKPIQLSEGGPVLGLLPAARYQQGQVELAPGDVLVLYSDGLVEAARQDGEEFGDERLAQLVERHASLPPAKIRDLVLAEVGAFTGKRPLADDRTLLIVRYEGAKTRESVIMSRNDPGSAVGGPMESQPAVAGVAALAA